MRKKRERRVCTYTLFPLVIFEGSDRRDSVGQQPEFVTPLSKFSSEFGVVVL